MYCCSKLYVDYMLCEIKTSQERLNDAVLATSWSISDIATGVCVRNN